VQSIFTNFSRIVGIVKTMEILVDKSLLYGVTPLNTGIAIDTDTPANGQGGSPGDMITWICITSLSTANCDVDSLQMLR